LLPPPSDPPQRRSGLCADDFDGEWRKAAIDGDRGGLANDVTVAGEEGVGGSGVIDGDA
jgi:hypothetical protein